MIRALLAAMLLALPVVAVAQEFQHDFKGLHHQQPDAGYPIPGMAIVGAVEPLVTQIHPFEPRNNEAVAITFEPALTASGAHLCPGAGESCGTLGAGTAAKQLSSFKWIQFSGVCHYTAPANAGRFCDMPSDCGDERINYCLGIARARTCSYGTNSGQLCATDADCPDTSGNAGCYERGVGSGYHSCQEDFHNSNGSDPGNFAASCSDPRVNFGFPGPNESACTNGIPGVTTHCRRNSWMVEQIRDGSGNEVASLYLTEINGQWSLSSYALGRISRCDGGYATYTPCGYGTAFPSSRCNQTATQNGGLPCANDAFCGGVANSCEQLPRNENTCPVEEDGVAKCEIVPVQSVPVIPTQGFAYQFAVDVPDPTGNPLGLSVILTVDGVASELGVPVGTCGPNTAEVEGIGGPGWRCQRNDQCDGDDCLGTVPDAEAVALGVVQPSAEPLGVIVDDWIGNSSLLRGCTAAAGDLCEGYMYLKELFTTANTTLQDWAVGAGCPSASVAWDCINDLSKPPYVVDARLGNNAEAIQNAGQSAGQGGQSTFDFETFTLAPDAGRDPILGGVVPEYISPNSAVAVHLFAGKTQASSNARVGAMMSNLTGGQITQEDDADRIDLGWNSNFDCTWNTDHESRCFPSAGTYYYAKATTFPSGLGGLDWDLAGITNAAFGAVRGNTGNNPKVGAMHITVPIGLPDQDQTIAADIPNFGILEDSRLATVIGRAALLASSTVANVVDCMFGGAKFTHWNEILPGLLTNPASVARCSTTRGVTPVGSVDTLFVGAGANQVNLSAWAVPPLGSGICSEGSANPGITCDAAPRTWYDTDTGDPTSAIAFCVSGTDNGLPRRRCDNDPQQPCRTNADCSGGTCQVPTCTGSDWWTWNGFFDDPNGWETAATNGRMSNPYITSNPDRNTKYRRCDNPGTPIASETEGCFRLPAQGLGNDCSAGTCTVVGTCSIGGAPCLNVADDCGGAGTCVPDPYTDRAFPGKSYDAGGINDDVCGDPDGAGAARGFCQSAYRLPTHIDHLQQYVFDHIEGALPQRFIFMGVQDVTGERFEGPSFPYPRDFGGLWLGSTAEDERGQNNAALHAIRGYGIERAKALMAAGNDAGWVDFDCALRSEFDPDLAGVHYDDVHEVDEVNRWKGDLLGRLTVGDMPDLWDRCWDVRVAVRDQVPGEARAVGDWSMSFEQATLAEERGNPEPRHALPTVESGPNCNGGCDPNWTVDGVVHGSEALRLDGAPQLFGGVRIEHPEWLRGTDRFVLSGCFRLRAVDTVSRPYTQRQLLGVGPDNFWNMNASADAHMSGVFLDTFPADPRMQLQCGPNNTESESAFLDIPALNPGTDVQFVWEGRPKLGYYAAWVRDNDTRGSWKNRPPDLTCHTSGIDWLHDFMIYSPYSVFNSTEDWVWDYFIAGEPGNIPDNPCGLPAVCGDELREGAEVCDGRDAAACTGGTTCNASCTACE